MASYTQPRKSESKPRCAADKILASKEMRLTGFLALEESQPHEG